MPPSPYTLTGFSQNSEHRIFVFEQMNADRSRTQFSVSADLSLTRRHGISLQELPLLCRSVLERRREQAGTEAQRQFVYTEAEMTLLASDRESARAAAAQKRKPPKRPVSPNAGSGWRVPHL